MVIPLEAKTTFERTTSALKGNCSNFVYNEWEPHVLDAESHHPSCDTSSFFHRAAEKTPRLVRARLVCEILLPRVSTRFGLMARVKRSGPWCDTAPLPRPVKILAQAHRRNPSTHRDVMLVRPAWSKHNPRASPSESVIPQLERLLGKDCKGTKREVT